MLPPKTPKQIEGLLKMARSEGYLDPVVINDIVCAIYPQTTTFGLVVDIRQHGYERRYCYEQVGAAMEALASYTDPADAHPSGPWIKAKGRFKGEGIDLLNPDIFRIEKSGKVKRSTPRDIPSVSFKDIFNGALLRDFQQATITKQIKSALKKESS